MPPRGGRRQRPAAHDADAADRRAPLDAPPAGDRPPTFPVLLDEVVAALAPRDGAIYVDGTFGAGGYSAALLAAARCRVFGIDRDPEAVRRGAALGGATCRPADPDRRPLRRHGAAGRAARAGPDRRRRARSRRLLDAARPRRARLLVPPRRAARHAHGRRRARAPPISSPGSPEAELAELIRDLGEERFARRVARAIVAARGERRSAAPASWPRSCAPRSRTANPASIRRPAPFRRCASRSTTSSANSTAASPAAERLLMPGGRLAVVVVPLARRSRGSRISCGGAAARRRAARGTRRRARPRPAPSFTLLSRRPVRPERRRDRAQPARPLGPAARRRAHRAPPADRGAAPAEHACSGSAWR